MEHLEVANESLEVVEGDEPPPLYHVCDPAQPVLGTEALQGRPATLRSRPDGWPPPAPLEPASGSAPRHGEGSR